MAASARRHAPASAYTISTVPAPSRTAAEACIIQSCAPNIRSAATNSVSRSIQPRFIAPPTQASSISTTAADAKNTMRDAKPKRTARPAPIALDDKAQGRTAAGEARPFQARPLIERRDDQKRAPIAGIGEPAVEDQALFGQQPLRSACHRGEDAPHHQIACREHRHQAETGRLGLEPGNDLRIGQDHRQRGRNHHRAHHHDPHANGGRKLRRMVTAEIDLTREIHAKQPGPGEHVKHEQGQAHDRSLGRQHPTGLICVSHVTRLADAAALRLAKNQGRAESSLHAGSG